MVSGTLTRPGAGTGTVGIGDSKADSAVGFAYGGNAKFRRGVDSALMGALIVCPLGWVDAELGGPATTGRFRVAVAEEGLSHSGGRLGS